MAKFLDETSLAALWSKIKALVTANKYTHPSYTAKSSGLYKVTVDGTGHISGTSDVTKSDITELGIPSSDTTYSAATTTANGLMSSADKTKLDGVSTSANNYAHPVGEGYEHLPSGGVSAFGYLSPLGSGKGQWSYPIGTASAFYDGNSTLPSASGVCDYINSRYILCTSSSSSSTKIATTGLVPATGTKIVLLFENGNTASVFSIQTATGKVADTYMNGEMFMPSLPAQSIVEFVYQGDEESGLVGWHMLNGDVYNYVESYFAKKTALATVETNVTNLSDKLGTCQILGYEYVTVAYSTMIADGASATASSSFTGVTGATNYVASLVKMTYLNPSNVTINASAKTLTVTMLNTSGGNHSGSCQYLLTAYKKI